MIYAYSAINLTDYMGWTKIGYTEQDVMTRIRQQTHTAGVKPKLEWSGNAIYDDGTGDTFRDTDFHSYLRKLGVNQKDDENNEWFEINGPDSEAHFDKFRKTRGIIDTEATVSYTLRKEQDVAVTNARNYFTSHQDYKDNKFLWNAKPRFGKTLSVYDLCKRMNASMVLVVTNRPSIANSWYDDYCKFLGDESGYKFVSETSSLKGRSHVIAWNDYERLRKKNPCMKCIEFLSLQDLKGAKRFGGKYDKLEHVADEKWDLLVIDEAHEGVDTFKTDVAFDHINRKFALHLSGTPFKALASEKFEEKAIFNWTYADEQKAKRDWNASSEKENPYADLPRLNMFTYQMSEIISDVVDRGIDINGETEEYAFDLNEFFMTNKEGEFVHEKAVDKFLDALTVNEKYPFSTPELRNELKHTFWLLKYVASAKALAAKLEVHPVFKEYKIVVAAGDGNIDDDEENTKAFDRVKKAIAENDKTITLSVGQLTTGITVPEWTAVLMLSNIGSPALYMQAAFRAQNPCLFSNGQGGYYRKENSYVFDFDPARTLDIFEKFANDLSTDTTSGKGDSTKRKLHVRELLNFFPVIGEDEKGKMIELDAEQVLSIPRKIRSVEVVRRGFMSDFLFQNIGNVFHAPPEVWNIISAMEAVKSDEGLPKATEDQFDVNPDGEIAIPEKKVIGTATDTFGDKIYAVDPDDIEDILFEAETTVKKGLSKDEALMKQLADKLSRSVTQPMLEKAKDTFDITKKAQKDLSRQMDENAKKVIGKAIADHRIAQNILEAEKQKKLATVITEAERKDIERKFEQKSMDVTESFKETVTQTFQEFAEVAGKTIVTRALTDKQEKDKRGIENNIRDHLRGFSRTIPAFLMAYGSDNDVTLANFDKIVPGEVFKEVTGISLEDFRFLRDGGPYTDPETGEEMHFEGKLFDEVVFDDSVKEFMARRKALANYFDESSEEDIFDYIPPQKTNQIFTPKSVVIQMVDMLEKENPGCFDDEAKTFADLYMKSGLYLAEIVKRLYRSERLKQLYPEPRSRLNHIFSEQIYGLAPTEIIYRIVLSFLLGFSEEIKIDKHNIKKCDAMELAKGSNFEDELRKIFF